MDPGGDGGEIAAVALERCRNCDAPVHGEFCSSCGQRTAEIRRPLLALLRELVTEVLEVDGRLRRTLRPFLLRPGWLSREFREGRRARYTSPLRLYIATSLLCFSMIALDDCVTEPEPDAGPVFQFDRAEDDTRWPRRRSDAAAPSLEDRLGDRLLELEALPPAEQTARISKGLNERMPKALLVLVPVFAMLCGLLTVGRGYLYIDHVVFALHVHSFWFVVIATGVFLPDPGQVVQLAAMALYATVAFKRAYALSWGGALWRAAIGSLVYGVLIALTMFALLLAAILYD